MPCGTPVPVGPWGQAARSNATVGAGSFDDYDARAIGGDEPGCDDSN